VKANNILNQPQRIFTSTQDHWKDNTIINNFDAYTKVQHKTETCEKDTTMRNRQSAIEQLARRAQLLAVGSSHLDHSNSCKTWPKTSFLQNHYFTTEQFARRVKTLVVASW